MTPDYTGIVSFAVLGMLIVLLAHSKRSWPLLPRKSA